MAYHSDWEELAKIDPKWAILSLPGQKYQKWDEEEFFKTGEQEIKEVLTKLKNQSLKINFQSALDFGCGMGRLTRALALSFQKVFGIDISPQMISLAKSLHQKLENINFIHNAVSDLSCFEDNKFDFIYSAITLQHISDRKIIKKYLQEFMRVLKPGGILYFQLPTVPNYQRFKSLVLFLRGKLYHLLVKLGVPRDYCYRRLKILPYMHMSYLPSDEIIQMFENQAETLQIEKDQNIDTRYTVRKKG